MRGHVQKRGKTWSFVIYLGRDADGKKKYKWVGGHATKREAEDALVEALERLRTGMWTEPGRTTVGEFLEQWLQATEPTVRDNTLRSYREMPSSCAASVTVRVWRVMWSMGLPPRRVAEAQTIQARNVVLIPPERAGLVAWDEKPSGSHWTDVMDSEAVCSNCPA